jgi:hypothetical protein
MIAPPCELQDGAAEIQALFAEARRRRRRRRIAGLIAGLVLAGSAAIGLAGGGRQHHAAARVSAPEHVRAVLARPGPPKFSLPAASVAWAAFGQLHIGDAATMAQHVAATDVGWFEQAGGHLFWSGYGRQDGLIRDFDIATGKIRRLVRGQDLFASPDGRTIYIVRTSTRFIEMAADGSGPKHLLTVPAGWYLPSYGSDAVAQGGIVLNANDDGSRPAPVIAIWYPRTGQVTIVGDGIPADVVTPPGARHSLIAWFPGSCRSGDCPIEITNTRTMATLTVRSPLRRGFTYAEGTFSPGGGRLAAFARRGSLSSNLANHSVLAIISTRTGRLRLVPAAHLLTQEDAGWAVWLPGGQRLLVGALLYSYAVDAQTLAARGFFFSPGAAGSYGDHNIMDSGDINFSATVLPPAAAGLRIRRPVPPHVPAPPRVPGRPQ